MKKLNVYNSNFENSVTIILNGEKVTINPKQTVQVETNSWFGDNGFRLDPKGSQEWIEAYNGRRNQNLILRLEY